MLRWPPGSTRWKLWDSLSHQEREILQHKRELNDNLTVNKRMKNDETHE